MSNNRNTTIERFHRSYIPEPNSGCWLWLGTTRPDGYGQMYCKLVIDRHGRNRRAHVLSFILHTGIIPNELCVLHSCDVRCCVNPEHLRLGTRPENSQDAIIRKRMRRGELHHNTALTVDQVRAIRLDVRVQRVIATEYGVCQMTISNIKTGRTWGDLL